MPENRKERKLHALLEIKSFTEDVLELFKKEVNHAVMMNENRAEGYKLDPLEWGVKKTFDYIRWKIKKIPQKANLYRKAGEHFVDAFFEQLQKDFPELYVKAGLEETKVKLHMELTKC